LGFSIDDRYLKRAGLDYWDKVEVKVWDSFEEVVENHRNNNIYLATTKAQTEYCEVDYQLHDMVVFGCETRGLPQEILEHYPRQQIRIPMLDIGRSLNLSNSVAIIVYEVLRQHKFPNLK
jgi:tRNA (cytidine/uridine-2'-O-)-methyltransferase